MASAPVLGPAHAGLFQASADHILAAAFHHAGTDLQALGTEVRVAHAVAVALDVGGALAGQLTARGVGAQRRQRAVEAARLQVGAARLGPRFDLRLAAARAHATCHTFSQAWK